MLTILREKEEMNAVWKSVIYHSTFISSFPFKMVSMRDLVHPWHDKETFYIDNGYTKQRL